MRRLCLRVVLLDWAKVTSMASESYDCSTFCASLAILGKAYFILLFNVPLVSYFMLALHRDAEKLYVVMQSIIMFQCATTGGA